MSACLAPDAFGHLAVPTTQRANLPLMQVGAVLGAAAPAFLVYWLDGRLRALTFRKLALLEKRSLAGPL